jgi:hypothetical protein
MQFSLSEEALRKLETAALDAMEKKHFQEALLLWEIRLRSGESGLAPFPLYALCLAETGRITEAEELCRKTAEAIAGLDASERQDQLNQLLFRVAQRVVELPLRPLRSADPEELFNAGDVSPSTPGSPGDDE